MDRRMFVGGMVAAGAAGTAQIWASTPGSNSPSAFRVDGDRVNEQLVQLAQFGKSPTGTRRMAYTDADRQGRDYIVQLMQDAGLEVRIDTAGNILGRREGTEAGAPAILFGSHIDSVPNGGNYDGDVGVLSSIEAVRTLSSRNERTRHPLEVVVFQNEEGGLVGSKAMAIGLTEAELNHEAISGKTWREGIGFLGGDVTRLDAARRTPDQTLCYLELHIEQGGTLETVGRTIGLVEGIVSLRQAEVTVDGFANHAGTTQMNNRQDAMLAAAQFAVEMNRMVRAMPGRQVATVGRIAAQPGAPNVVPGRVVFSIDYRDLAVATLDRLEEGFRDIARKVEQETGTRFGIERSQSSAPALMNHDLRAMIATSAEGLGLTTYSLPSGAGHDAQQMAKIAPTAMIFIPSRGGISHSPEEYSSPEDVVHGANTLLRTILQVDQHGLTRSP